MDTQIKISFIFKTIVNTKKMCKVITDTTPYNGFLESNAIKFTEHTLVIVKFESNDKNAFLEIVSYDSEKFNELRNGEEKIICSGEEKENMLTPGDYPIVIRTSTGVYEDLYRIESSSMSWSGLLNIRNYLENMVAGLSYNIYMKRKRETSAFINNNVFLSEIYVFLQNNKKTLEGNLNSIIVNPLTDIKKIYKEEIYSRKPDIKSQKWLSKKGVSVNNNPYQPIRSFEKHSTITKNIIENKYIKKIMHYISKSLKELEDAYLQECNNINKKMQTKYEELEQVKKELRKDANDFCVVKKIRKKEKDRKYNLEKHIIEFKIQLSKIKSISNTIKKQRKFLMYYEYESWLRDITNYNKINKPSLRLLKDKRYGQIYKFYKYLMSIKNRNIKDKFKASFENKQTSKLFEYYTFVLIIRILENYGYKWTKGWLMDEENCILKNGDLPPETKLKLESENFYCELVYDMEIKMDYNNENISGFVSVNSNHTRPDIRLALFSKQGYLKGAVIIEVKCRKRQYIINEKGPVMEQLKDYYNLGYRYYGEYKPKREVIENVIVTYPKQNNYKVKEYFGYKFPLIQLEARDDSIYGYDELKEEIEEFLKKVTRS